MKLTIKRLLAYVIDILVIFLIFFVLYNLLPSNNEIIELNHKLKQLEEQLFNQQINFGKYLEQFIKISYQIDKSNVLLSAINILLVIVYFIIVPMFTKGKTLGLYLMNLKIKSEENLKIFSLFIRNIFTTGILYMMICLFMIFLVKSTPYFIIITILGFIQILLVIISSFMVIYRKDKKGLQDILSNTVIIENKEVQK